MANPEDPTTQKSVESETPAAGQDVEAQSSSAAGFGVSSIVKRWKREDLLKKGSLVLRAFALFFSLLSFLIMATNKHGYGRNFDDYEEYRYLLAISIISVLYCGFQVLRQIHQFSTGKQLFSPGTSVFLNFFGDQIVAYLLISAASTAVPTTNRMREGADNIFTDSSAASISMAFLAFIPLAASAMLSGFKASNRTYI